jgi:Holliday junction resolvase RusA-like endonuclease
MTIVVKGVPIAKKRPRFVRIGKGVRTYNSQETEEGRWLWEASQQVQAPIEGPIRLTAMFYMPVPKSASKKKQAEALDGGHTKKPDLDNLVKFIKDCLNGVAWKDDSQVCELYAQKVYGEEPRTEITIESA